MVKSSYAIRLEAAALGGVGTPDDEAALVGHEHRKVIEVLLANDLRVRGFAAWAGHHDVD